MLLRVATAEPLEIFSSNFDGEAIRSVGFPVACDRPLLGSKASIT